MVFSPGWSPVQLLGITVFDNGSSRPFTNALTEARQARHTFLLSDVECGIIAFGMKCALCGKSEARVHLTVIVEDNIQKVDLCEACAVANRATDPN